MTSHAAIAGVFNSHLAARYRTLLVGGAAEPLYLPPTGSAPAVILYTRDYARSVLHELAHWALAGKRRRGLLDYGYWYLPPPRSDRAQADFFAAELRVQALESLFCSACGVDFQVSADNLNADCAAFAHRVRAEARAQANGRMGMRARRVLQQLSQLRA